jgi:hypothetical protein
MNTIFGNIKWQKPFLVLLISTYLMSCTHWKVLREPYSEQLKKEKPEIIEVESIYGRKIIMKHPHIVGDSLFGIYERNDPVGFGQLSDTIAVGVNEIVTIREEKKFHESRTGSLIVGTSLFIGIVIIAVVLLPKPNLL